MIKCPSCGHENVDGTQFCEMCGEELADAKAGAPAGTPAAGGAGATADAAGMIKCPACDNMNPADNLVCEVCGTELRPGALSGAPTAGGAPMGAPASTGAPSTTPFDTTAPSQMASASTAASAPTPASADTATSTSTDATLPTVSISSADPVTTDPLSNDPLAPPLPSSMPQTAPAQTDAVSMAPVTSLDATPVPLDATVVTAPGATASSGGVLEPGRVKMVVEQGMTVGKQFVLGDAEVLVGREDDGEGIYPDIDLSDQDEGYVHRRHAMLKFENGGLSVTHLGGANKTRVNNKPLADNTPQPVNMGDKVAFGKVVMRVQSA